MRTFLDFIKEEDGNQQPIAPGSQMPLSQVSGGGALPPTGSNPSGGTTNVPEQDQLIERLTNDIQRRIQQLFVTLDKHSLNKQKAMNMLSTIIAGVANQYGLNNSNIRQATQAGMQFNSEPSSPPLQPMANG